MQVKIACSVPEIHWWKFFRVFFVFREKSKNEENGSHTLYCTKYVFYICCFHPKNSFPLKAKCIPLNNAMITFFMFFHVLSFTFKVNLPVLHLSCPTFHLTLEQEHYKSGDRPREPLDIANPFLTHHNVIKHIWSHF